MTACTVIGVSGGIATGKTTFAAQLSAALGDATLASEDVSENPYLDDFYKDMTSWGFHSRIAFLAMKLAALVGADHSAKYLVLDRPVHELVTFARMHLDAGVLSQRDFDTFYRLHSTLLQLIPPLDCVVNVYCAPAIAQQRIRRRGRAFEQLIDISYLERIPSYYRRWLDERPAPQVIEFDSGLESVGSAVVKVLTRLGVGPTDVTR
jgi:deoxyadenosine/deoxycytidine kinase